MVLGTLPLSLPQPFSPPMASTCPRQVPLLPVWHISHACFADGVFSGVLPLVPTCPCELLVGPGFMLKARGLARGWLLRQGWGEMPGP